MSNVEKYKQLNETGTREEREQLLKQMTNAEIDELINKWAGSIQCKIYLKKFKK